MLVTHLSRRARITGALTLVAVTAAGAGLAFGAIPGSDGSIDGCYTKIGGILRVIDKGAGQNLWQCADDRRWVLDCNPGYRLVAGTPPTCIEIPPLVLSSFVAPDPTISMTILGDRPVARVTLSQPAEADTFIAVVTSSNPGVLEVFGGGTVVRTGFTVATVRGVTVSPGTTVLTATLGASALTANLEVTP